jgi:hypothetical protein
MRLLCVLLSTAVCLANWQLLNSLHSVADQRHRKLIGNIDTAKLNAAIEKCMTEAAAAQAGSFDSAVCAVMLKASASELVGITEEQTKTMCSGSPSCAQQVQSIYNKAQPCMNKAIDDALAGQPELVKAAVKKSQNTTMAAVDKVMCLKNSEGKYCLPKFALLGKLAPADGAQLNDATDPNAMKKIFEKMCGIYGCFGTCLDDLMTLFPQSPTMSQAGQSMTTMMNSFCIMQTGKGMTCNFNEQKDASGQSTGQFTPKPGFAADGSVEKKSETPNSATTSFPSLFGTFLVFGVVHW